jgi:IS30 family transposase
MGRRRGNHARRLSDDERRELRRRVAEGETFAQAAATVGCSAKSVSRLMAKTGGLRQRLTARSAWRLSFAEREDLSRGLVAGDSLQQIAGRVGRPVSTLSREVARNGGRSTYRAWHGETTAARRARRPKPAKLAWHTRLRCEVERRLWDRWSPQQIAARLVIDYPDDLTMRVSHETIYQTLFVQARGALRKELTACLRTGRTQRRAHKRTEHSGTGRIRDMVPISARPSAVEDRAIPGHWEGDLLFGRGGKSAIGTLVERSSRYVLLVPLPDGRTAAEVRAALTRAVIRLPADLRRTLTWDQGKEMAEHVRFSIDTAIKVYFCDPHSPWQRGTNENTNGLLRQYFPTSVDLRSYTRAELNAVARQLNNRPRLTLGWQKPAEVFCRTVALTG